MSPTPAAASLPERPLKVLFFIRNFRGYFRVFEPLLKVLAQRGHRVHLAYDDKGTSAERRWAQDLSAQYPTITFGATPNRRGHLWYRFGRSVRLSRDYVRFLRPEFDRSPDLRDRAAKRAPPSVSRLSRWTPLRRGRGLAWLTSGLDLVERAIPTGAEVESFIRGQDPDVVLISPLLTIGSLQPEYLKTAQSLGLPTVVCVASWDNLSSKSPMLRVPDAVTVWNETQKREAVEMHGVPPERVIVTGAQAFDHWFDWKPRPREEFCRRMGLDPERPYLLYLCSSLFASRLTEAEFVRTWVARVRGSGDPRLREAGILIRPHPKRGKEWEAVDLSAQPNVTVHPPAGRMPVTADAKADYFDALYHSAAVVGLNTSALIEAGIVGRPVHTLMNTEFASSQDGTLHFEYLMKVGGGLLRVAHDLEEHLSQLSRALADEAGRSVRPTAFLEAFIRPHGIDVAASPVFADAVESVARRPRPQPARPTAGQHLLRAALFPLAVRSEVARRFERLVYYAKEMLATRNLSNLLRILPKRRRSLVRRAAKKWLPPAAAAALSSPKTRDREA
jgi:hypothetical protein